MHIADMSETNMTDGQILKSLMEDLQVSVATIRERTGWSRQNIYNKLNDDNKKGIDLKDWQKIGQALHVDIYEFVPRLKGVKKAKGYQMPVDPDQGRVEDLENHYARQQKDIEFLKQSLKNDERIIAAKNEVIEIQNVRIRELEAQVKELKARLK